MEQTHSKIYDVAVVGGGSIGLSCAWNLAKSGARVVLFDRAQTGQEASYAAGGMLAPACETIAYPTGGGPSANRAMFDLCCQSRDFYAAFAGEVLSQTGHDIELCLNGAPIARWRTPGILFVGRLGSEASEERVNQLKQHGAASHWGERPAVWLETDGQVDTRKLADALRAAALGSGVEIREDSTIVGVESQNGRVIGVSDEKTLFRAGKVLLCTGAWSSKISGVPPEIGASVRPLMGQMVQLHGDHIVKQVIYSDDIYLVPRRDGRLLLGATAEEAGFSKQVTAGGVAKLINAAIEMVPALREAPLQAHWAGLRPISVDGLPMMGQTRVPGLFAATGHGRNGVLLAPITGRLVSDLMLQGTEISADFSPNRFVPERQTVEAQTVEAQTVEAQTVEAQTVEAQTA